MQLGRNAPRQAHPCLSVFPIYTATYPGDNHSCSDRPANQVAYHDRGRMH